MRRGQQRHRADLHAQRLGVGVLSQREQPVELDGLQRSAPQSPTQQLQLSTRRSVPSFRCPRTQREVDVRFLRRIQRPLERRPVHEQVAVAQLRVRVLRVVVVVGEAHGQRARAALHLELPAFRLGGTRLRFDLTLLAHAASVDLEARLRQLVARPRSGQLHGQRIPTRARCPEAEGRGAGRRQHCSVAAVTSRLEGFGPEVLDVRQSRVVVRKHHRRGQVGQGQHVLHALGRQRQRPGGRVESMPDRIGPQDLRRVEFDPQDVVQGARDLAPVQATQGRGSRIDLACDLICEFAGDTRIDPGQEARLCLRLRTRTSERRHLAALHDFANQVPVERVEFVRPTQSTQVVTGRRILATMTLGTVSRQNG